MSTMLWTIQPNQKEKMKSYDDCDGAQDFIDDNIIKHFAKAGGGPNPKEMRLKKERKRDIIIGRISGVVLLLIASMIIYVFNVNLYFFILKILLSTVIMCLIVFTTLAGLVLVIRGKL